MDYNPQTENEIDARGEIFPVHFERNFGMLICDDIWNDTWFVSIPQRQKILYLYLLSKSSKCGIFELNTRTINFDLMCEGEKIKPYTIEEILTFAGDRIKPINDTKAIIVAYIRVNWMRGKSFDPTKNPLHRGIQQELARYGLTIDSINELQSYKKPKVETVNQEDVQEDLLGGHDGAPAIRPEVIDYWFDRFWDEYPKECPRKVDKKKCREKFCKIIKPSPEIVHDILIGLETWKKSETWLKDGGKYIKAPLVWLNSENWKDNPKKGTDNGNNNSTGVKVRENSFHGSAQNFKGLF